MPQLNDKKYLTKMAIKLKAYVIKRSGVLGLAFGLLGIFVVSGWLQYLCLTLGSVFFVIARLHEYLKNTKSDD